MKQSTNKQLTTKKTITSKSRKTPHLNTDVAKVSTKVPAVNDKPTTPFFDYLDTFTFKQKPASIPFIERLAVELSNWAVNDEEAIKISQFYIKRGISKQDFTRWMEWVPALKEAYSVAMEAIGNRREVAGLTKKFDSSMVQFTMPQYDQGWKEMNEWRAKLREQIINQNNGPQIIVLEKYPDSDLVPDKPRPTPEDVAKKLAKHPEMRYRKTRYD